ncbi:MAG: extracellular solute-binding protein [Acidimicrobiales bacterium]|nr:extracellular solute-binding protein [Acidimicrobiales bacterium]
MNHHMNYKVIPQFLKKGLLVLGISLLLFACGDDKKELEGAAKTIFSGECVNETDETIVIYSGRSENLILPVIEAFVCETGIKVDTRWGSSTDMALLIDEEGSKTQADVFLSRSPGPVGYLDGEGYLKTITTEVLNLVDENMRSKNATWIGFSGRQRVLVYNTDQYSEDTLPVSIFDLTSPEYEGKVAIPGSNGSFIDWFTILIDQYGDKAAGDWINQMVDNGARYYPNNRSIVEAVGRGEIAMGLVNHYYNYKISAATGPEHKASNHVFKDNDIGGTLIISAAAILDSSDKSAKAEDFITYLLSPQAQSYFTETTYEYPIAAGVESNSALSDLQAFEIGSIDFDSLGEGFENANKLVESSGILNQ